MVNSVLFNFYIYLFIYMYLFIYLVIYSIIYLSIYLFVYFLKHLMRVNGALCFENFLGFSFDVFCNKAKKW